ncbi:hypothetical protein ScPMuIL_004298 [Solemya velum]
MFTRSLFVTLKIFSRQTFTACLSGGHIGHAKISKKFVLRIRAMSIPGGTYSVGATSNTMSKHENRLAKEKSPYLLQHANNPIDWYPWGIEAFQKAKAENKLIFLSVGYSTCHWCHVMEKESFENEEVGKIMNDNFVSIKVDREERPDVDRIYMSFIQATSGGGGWPMSVWLTPDLKPIVGGSYFPPNDRYYGRPGFITVLRTIAEKWQADREQIERQGTAILDALMKGLTLQEACSSMQLPGDDVVQKCYQMLEKSHDSEFGGFGMAPKFPHPVNYSFLFNFYGNNKELEDGEKALEMCLLTLRMMAKGGIHDHISKGFHRYSTDKLWHVPHFEKMLYDQAQLAVAYLDAFQITKDEQYADTVRDILEYVSRDLSHPEGGFYSAEDADSHPTADCTQKKEGAFCVWTYGEVQQLLTDKIEGHSGTKLADIFCHHFSVMDGGNVDPYQDPHQELKNQNVLFIKDSVAETAIYFGISKELTNQVLNRCVEILYNARQKRPRPQLDDKMVTAWNGLMISAYARAGQILNDDTYTTRAVKAAEFLRLHMYLQDKRVLLRTCYSGADSTVTQIPEPIEGFVDDYAFLIRGLIDLYQACFDEKWLDMATDLQKKQNDLFWDSENSGFYSISQNDEFMIMRLKEDQDGAEPSGNSVAAMNLIRLASFLNKADWIRQAEQVMMVFHEQLTRVPIAVPELVSSLMFLHSKPIQIIIVGDKDLPETKQLIACVHQHYLPNKILICVPDNSEGFFNQYLDILPKLEKISSHATAYVCQNFTCSLPVTSADKLSALLCDPKSAQI